MSIRGEGRERSPGFDTSQPVGSFFEVVREVILDPRGFFAGLKAAGGGRPGGEKAALIFAIISAYIGLPLVTLAEPVNRRLDPFASENGGPFSGFFPLLRESPGIGLVVAAGVLVLVPLFALLGAYVGAFVQHLFVMLFVRDRGTFYDTFAVGVYRGSALTLFSWIPILGYLVALYGIYVRTVGYKEMHTTTTTRALLAALGPAVISLLLTLPGLLGAPAGPR